MSVLNEEYLPGYFKYEIREQYKQIIDKVSNKQYLADREVNMLFFWQRHKDARCFSFLNNYIQSKSAKKKHHRNSYTKKGGQA